jgi:deferrochelatase/peroxidase EfeB
MLAVLQDYPLLLRQEAGETLTAEEARAAKDQLRRFERQVTDYRYGDDPEGLRCPLGAHVRRANPRDMLDPEPLRDAATGRVLSASSSLVNRRRIMRRGLPYGEPSDRDEDEHGVFIMAICGSLFRQFEFVQQQWMQYGLDLDSGNDTCPIIGNRGQAAKYVIPAGPDGTGLPYVAANLPQFVETRGGEYFFLPSLNALRMIAMGEIDPT